MRPALLAGFALCLTVISTDAAPRRDQTYVDDRYGIASIVPKNWTLLPPEPNLNGTRFVSPDGDAWLALYKTVAGPNVAAQMSQIAFRRGEKITYSRRARDWIVVSGFKGDRIFYRRAMLACGNANWHHVSFEYPANEKRAFDRLVTRTSNSLKLHRNDGCGPATARR
jgi:serine/threonine-protein kinase